MPVIDPNKNAAALPSSRNETPPAISRPARPQVASSENATPRGRPSIDREMPEATCHRDGIGVQGVEEGDLLPLRGMSRDRLIAELSRIDLALEDGLAIAPSAELQLGRQMLGEQIRRLRMIQTATDALIGK